MNKKNSAILILALLVLIGTIMFIAKIVDEKGGVSTVPDNQAITKTENKVIPPEKDIPKDNVTIDQMTKEQADFAQEFSRKTKAK